MRVELWLFLIPFALSRRITPEENDHIKAICGATERKAIPLSFGGRPIGDNEYPWVVSITYGGPEQVIFTCSGALISSRHVLTAARCVREVRNVTALSPEACKRIGYKNTNKLRAPVSNFTVAIGSVCKYLLLVCPKIYQKKIAKIYVPDNFDECSYVNDLAIMELETPVSEVLATPICIPSKFLKLATTLQLAGIGFRGPANKFSTLFPNGFHVVGITPEELILKKKQIATTAPRTVGICPGDIGGPLFQKYGQKNTIVGVLSNGGSCAPNDPKKKIKELYYDFFTDVRKFRGWICHISGVCPGRRRQERSHNQKGNYIGDAIRLLHKAGIVTA